MRGEKHRRDEPLRMQDARRKEGSAVHEGGATAGKTHEQVLGETVGRDRGSKAVGGAGPPQDDEP